jgi:hypothetical protein
VNKSQKEESRDLGVKIEEDKDSISRLNLGDSAYVTDTSAEKGNSIVKKVGVVKARDKQAINVVINCKGNKKVINNSKKVFSVFNNNKDKDYKKSSKDKDVISENGRGLDVAEVNGSDNKKGLSKVDISKSNNKDYTKAGNNSRKVSVMKDDKNISEKKSR